jgi:serine/threonine protein kinase
MAIVYKPHQAPEPNEGEKRLIQFLEVNLPDDYYIVPNGEYASLSPQGMMRFWEYDCLVVAPHAVYHLENKDWNGHLEGDDFAWFINGAERKNPHKSASLKSKILAALLAKHNPAWSRTFVATAVTLSSPSQSKFGLDPQCSCYQQTFTLTAPDLINFITDHNRARKPANHIADIQKDIVDFLTGQSSHRSSIEKTTVLDYNIIEILQNTESFTEYLCQPKLFVDKRYKVREYPLDFADKSPKELEVIRNRAENARHAQEKLDPCPYIVKCNCHLNDAQTVFYEISDYIEECTLRAKLRQKTFTQLEKIRIILDVAHALKEAHSKNVFHRDVCPENIYLLNSGTAALANFGHSWFSEHSDMHYTVASILQDESSPYTPPEFSEDDVSASSDLYSLGVIFYELMTDKLPFESTGSFRTLGIFPDALLPSHIISDLPDWTDEVVKHTVNLDQNKRWQTADEMIDFIESHLQKQSEPTKTTTIYLKDLKPGDNLTHELVLYEELGKGGFGRVFKAKHLIQNKFYAVKVFDKDASVQETINEFKALEDLKHKNIVEFVYNGKSNQGLFYTLMELLEGENLGSYTKGDLRLPNMEIYKMLQQILSAMVFMQSKEPPVYHRDIKPNNIVWDKHQRYVLIDFNISTTTDDKAFAGTRPYMAPDLVASGNNIDWDTSADTFSLGVTLYELLTHIYPWPGSNPCPKTMVAPTDIRTYNDKLSADFADFVMKSIVTDRNQRFRNAQEMLDVLNTIGPDGITKDTNRVVNTLSGEHSDIVDYVNSLYSQSIHGNSGTRVSSKEHVLDKLTYTQTKLDKKLIGDIKQGKYKLIIITGNAGDGKTAFIRKVEAEDHQCQRLDNHNGAKFTLNGIPFVSNYDGSQDEEERANDDVLADFFKPFYYLSQYDQLSEGRIIAINEGRLIDFLHSQPGLRQLDDNIEDYFYREGHVELLPGLMVINLNLRSVTARGENDTPSLLSQQIKAITQPELWTKCHGCPVADRCYIRYNVETFQDSTSGEAVITRLEWLLRTIVYKRELHITMRDLRSMIAFMLTRDYSCEQVKKLIEYVNTEGLAEYYWQYYYFNITAPYIVPVKYFPFPSLDSNDRLIRLLRETDIARVALPSCDRDLYFRGKRPEDYLIFTDRNQSLLDSFNTFNSQMPGWEKNPEKKQIIEIRHHCYIRHQYFEGLFDYQQRLPYRHISDFANLMKTNDTPNLQGTKEALAEAISNSEGCFNKEIQKHHLLLAGSHTKDPISKSYKRFPLADFELFVNNTSHLTQYIEYESDSLIFRHKTDQHIQLTVSLDLYEMLKFIQEGFNPSINDLRGRFIELQIFKNLLESKTYNEIIVTKNGLQYYVIRLSEDKVIQIKPLTSPVLC